MVTGANSSAQSSLHQAERELLLRCCRESRPAIHGIPDFDWAWLVHQAVENGVTPLLYLVLKDHSDVPDTVREELFDEHIRGAAQGLRLADALTEVAAHFRQQGIPALAYKGPALSMLAYGSATMRSFGDLDILVRRSDVAVAASALEEIGYRCTLSAKQQEFYLLERYHLHFSGGDPRVNIEIHWAVTPGYWPFPLDEKRLWNGSNSVEMFGVSVPTLDRELTLLALCAHGAKERWPRLGLVCDLHRLVVCSPDLDWNWITEQTVQMRRSRVLLLGLLLAASLLETPIPEALLSQARADSAVVTNVNKIGEQIFGGDLLAGLSFHRYACQIWNRWPDRLGYLRYAAGAAPRKLTALAQPSAADGSLPAGLSWLWRPLRVAWKSKNLRRTLRRIADNF